MSKETPNDLVEEIADTFRVMDIYQSFPYQLERIIRLAISRIGKAYADGELELPGEETRIKGCYVSELGGYRDIIVFRKEEETISEGEILINAPVEDVMKVIEGVTKKHGLMAVEDLEKNGKVTIELFVPDDIPEESTND